MRSYPVPSDASPAKPIWHLNPMFGSVTLSVLSELLYTIAKKGSNDLALCFLLDILRIVFKDERVPQSNFQRISIGQTWCHSLPITKKIATQTNTAIICGQ